MKTFGFQWHLTDRCNLRCAHCYQDDFSPRSEPSLDELRGMADRIFTGLPDRPISVNLTGGEPLLYPHLSPLLAHLHTFENLKECHLITNATVVNEAQLGSLREFEKLCLLKLSIESGVEAVNDAIRGDGNLQAVRQNLERYQEKLPRPQVLMTTLGRYNLETIEQTVRFAREAGAAGVIFERFIPLGQGRRLQDETLDRSEWRQAVAEICRLSRTEIDHAELLPYRAFWLWLDPERAENLQAASCNLGDESMALMPDGTVYPCRRLPLKLGNLLAEPFEEILARLEGFRLPELRKRLGGELCRSCPVEGCAGCRASAYAIFKDPYADDPQCPRWAEMA